MPLIFSPLSDEVIALPPRELFPRHAFVMRQIGSPPEIDQIMTKAVTEVLEERGFSTKDANASTGSKDFLERILSLIRGTGFTIAIFSAETRGTALANIMLELGFAAMCGKPLMIVKSKGSAAPSDLTRTDWVEFDPKDMPGFKTKIGQALDQIEKLADYEEMLLDVALDAPAMDCAIAFERALKAFLLSGEQELVKKAQSIKTRLAEAQNVAQIADLQRLSDEIGMFICQGKA